MTNDRNQPKDYGQQPQRIGTIVIDTIRGVTPQPTGDRIQGGVQPQHTPTTGQEGGKPPAHE